MNHFSSVVPFFGPVFAALTAGIISLVLAIIAKDQKTSEFRQAWIDGLRSEISDLVGLMEAVDAIAEFKANNGDDPILYLSSMSDDMIKIYSLTAKVRLRLNPKEHKNIIVILESLHSGAQEIEVSQCVVKLVGCAQIVLKEEWVRVKRGERSFRVLKAVSGLVALSSIIAVIYFMYGRCFSG